MTTPPNVNHIAFACRDLAAQEAFYTKHFGCKRSRTFNAGQFMLKMGNTRLELFSSEHMHASVNKGGEQPVGYKHLAFDVESIDPILAGIRADGMNPGSIIDLGGGARILFFCDPEGNIIELMEGYKDDPEA
jgi:catechol 2,3-dioxygenase-like lactoylglutathione lyase family enzyme